MYMSRRTLLAATGASLVPLPLVARAPSAVPSLDNLHLTVLIDSTTSVNPSFTEPSAKAFPVVN
ncbi:hypothetical protein [Novosphingobium sp. SG720]|uniref:hypothetical protein n=1 Tax=Novosphingobium sp. SG720 TaxID=2586998 RepID=UPI0014456907|nr:hypothetical protein [Novosphingobium sp. SG720]NKJ44244.1 hypothetical protein [Novosphingobium sp. SG720]